MNQVMTPYQQRFGNPYLCRATLSLWKKVCLYRGIWRILLGAVDQYPEWWPELWLPLTEWSPHRSMQKQSVELGVLYLTMFDHRRNLVMKLFWPVFVIEFSDTDMRLCHIACALLLEWFLAALSHGKVLFSDECAIYCSSLSWNVFWGETESLLHAWDVRPHTTHDDSAGVTASCIIGPYFFDGTVCGVICVKCGITLYQSQATVGLFNRCHFSKIVPSAFHPDSVWIPEWIINSSVYWLGLCNIPFTTVMVAT